LANFYPCFLLPPPSLRVPLTLVLLKRSLPLCKEPRPPCYFPENHYPRTTLGTFTLPPYDGRLLEPPVTPPPPEFSPPHLGRQPPFWDPVVLFTTKAMLLTLVPNALVWCSDGVCPFTTHTQILTFRIFCVDGTFFARRACAGSPSWEPVVFCRAFAMPVPPYFFGFCPPLPFSHFPCGRALVPGAISPPSTCPPKRRFFFIF